MDVERVVADEGVARIKFWLPTQYKYLGRSGGTPIRNPVPHNAGYYQRQIHSEARVNEHIVTDDGVVYGPWLEGESERNKTTRFRGYHTFRIITKSLKEESGRIAENMIPPYLAAMDR